MNESAPAPRAKPLTLVAMSLGGGTSHRATYALLVAIGAGSGWPASPPTSMLLGSV